MTVEISRVPWSDERGAVLRRLMSDEMNERYEGSHDHDPDFPRKAAIAFTIDPATVLTCVLATDDGEPVGHAALHHIEDYFELKNVIVAPSHRGRGLGPLRVAVACAGIAPPAKLLGRDGPLPLDRIDRVLRVDLLGTLNLARLAAERIARTDPVDGERGVLVTTASVAAFDGQIGQVAYAAAKAGVAGATLPMARELAAHLIRVVSIAPGIFDTPLLAALPEAARESLGAQVPHPSRLGRPEEFAALVLHVVGNPMLNGEVIRLDGGIRMAPR